MKKIFFLFILIMDSFFGFAQDMKPVESKISSITVFLNRAQVSREVRTKIEAGKTNLVLRGLTSQLDPQSIQVSGKGNFIIHGISHQQNFLNAADLPNPIKILKDSIEYLQRAISFLNSEKEILTKEEQMLMNNQKINGANQNLTVAELKAMADFFRNRLTDIVSSRLKKDQQIKQSNEKLSRLQRQLNEQNDMYNRNPSEIIIAVSADVAGAAEFTVSYVTAGAGWTPVYDLRAIDTKNPVQLNYKANVFQNTGEQWNNVKLRLSTANPALGGQKPELATWYLDFYYPRSADAALRKSKVSAAYRADAEEELQEVVMMAPAESVSDYVTTVQTSLNTEFDIALPYTVSSSSKPTLVDIRTHSLKASYDYAVAPKLDRDAFLVGRVTGWEELSLLPGEANVFFEGTFVGKSFLDPNSIKDTLSISLGRDKRIVVKREQLKDFSSRKTIGTNQKETKAFEISVRNTKNEPVTIKVEDQLPISKNNQIEVSVLDVGGARHDKNTGKIVWDLSLQPNETKKASFKYEIKYPRDKSISGLE